MLTLARSSPLIEPKYTQTMGGGGGGGGVVDFLTIWDLYELGGGDFEKEKELGWDS